MRNRLALFMAALILLPSLITGAAMAQDFRLAVLPRFFPIYMHERFSELTDALETEAGLRVELEIADSYEDHMEKVGSGMVHFGFQNPLVYLKVSNQVTPVAVARQGRGGTRMRGVIITRADSGITAPQGLRGRKVSVVSTQSAGGYLSQKEFLKKYKIDTVMDLLLRETGDNVEENVIMDVFEGRADAGFISAGSLHRMDRVIDPTKLRVLATTAWVPNWIFTAHRTVATDVVGKVRACLQSLSDDKALMARLGLDGFVAPDAAYLKSIEKLDFW